MYRTNLQKNIVIPSLIIIASVALGCIMVPEGANAVLTFLKQELFNSFSWIYILSVAFFYREHRLLLNAHRRAVLPHFCL
ncbi:hypothetical protein FYJ78_09460 [Selenomonas sp. WCA-380-WT-3B 3/]|uniref:Uncharacterized protein n=1 Tax=Selenomonas montiformis TaxID=2652285 RepID=A0A6I2UZ81_9FIRM|nr:hypothetical protein [Selenomonas montiformis]